MLIQGSKIKLIKPMGAFTNIGEVCEVTDIGEGGVISFRFGGVHLGYMSYDEYEKYFEKVEAPVKKEWSAWHDTKIGYTNLDDELVQKRIQYRENGVRLQVRCDGLKARSSCHGCDSFDLSKGLELATRRLIVKMMEEENKKYASEM